MNSLKTIGLVLLAGGVQAAVLITADGAWSSSAINASSNGGLQSNSHSGGAFGLWGGPSFNVNAESLYLDMEATGLNIQPVCTAGYTYRWRVKAAAAREDMMNNQVSYLLAGGSPVSASRLEGPNNDGTFGPDNRHTIYGSYPVAAGDAQVGKTVGLRLTSEGIQSRYLADGDTELSVLLTTHAGFNGDGLLYETSFETNAAGVVGTDYVLDMAFQGTGTFGNDSGINCCILVAAEDSAESCSVASAGDTFRRATAYELSFQARCSQRDDSSRIIVSLGSFATNIAVGSEYVDCSLTVNADKTGISGEPLGVELVPMTASAGTNEFWLKNLSLSAVSQTIGCWYEDNNMGVNGGAPPDFSSRFEPDNIASWQTSLETMEVYYLRYATYRDFLKTNSALKTRMAEVFSEYGIRVALDDTAATWAHLLNDYSTPSYQRSIDVLQDLTGHGWDLCAVGLQSVLSKPRSDGTAYAMEWRILDVVEYIRQVKPEFPQLEYGVIDALPAKQMEYKSHYTTLKAAVENAGYTLDFIEQDFPIDFGLIDNSRFKDMVVAECFVRTVLGCRAGLYLTSSRGGQTSDELFRSDVISGLDQYLTGGGAPDRITLAAWYEHPVYSAPDETDSTVNTNGSTMLGTFLLLEEEIKEHGFADSPDAATVSVDSDSPLKITATGSSSAADGVVIRWDALTGREYSLYSTTNLCSPFRLEEDEMVYPQNCCTNFGIKTNSSVFYKLEVGTAASE